MSLKCKPPSPPDKILTLSSLAATQEFAFRIGQALSTLHGSHTVLLDGSLGSGKTTLCKGICHGLGVDPMIVTSPTYTLVNVYPTLKTNPIYHVDLYRLEDSQDLLQIDINDWHNLNGITLIEWPALAVGLLPPEECLWINILYPKNNKSVAEARMFSFWGSSHFADLLDNIF